MSLYLIIFGTRGVTYTSSDGNFHCPSCGQQPYRQRRVRRFFTLYFIPVIPLDLLGEYVECGQCMGTYDPGVLSYNPEESDQQFEAEFQHAIKRTMVLMCLADGVVDDNEIETIREVYGRIAGREITADEVSDEITTAMKEGGQVADFLKGVVGMLNDSGKELVIKAAFFVAAADGEFQEEEQQLLAEIGKVLEMSQAHLNGVIESLLSDEGDEEPN